jgi:hypothetical protein
MPKPRWRLPRLGHVQLEYRVSRVTIALAATLLGLAFVDLVSYLQFVFSLVPH